MCEGHISLILILITNLKNRKKIFPDKSNNFENTALVENEKVILYEKNGRSA